MARDGEAAGYFFALLTVIAALPGIFLISRFYLLHYATEKEKRIEIRLEKSAIKYMMEYRQALIQQNLEIQRNSLKQQSKQFLKDNVKLEITSSLMADQQAIADSEHFVHLLRQQHTFWGIEDLILKEGKLKYGETLLIQFPKGIFEDFLYYVINNVNPITFLFASEKHPQSMISRFVSYTTAQTFVLLIYLSVRNGTARTIIGYLFSPLTLLIEHWLNLMLVCPCLPEVPKEETYQQQYPQEVNPLPIDNNGGQVQQSKVPLIAHKAIYHTIRAFGWLLAFPILFVLIFILVDLAVLLANHTIEHHLLGMFVVDGILIPFLLKLLLVSVNYFWFIHPTHLVVCCIKVLTINSWTESQTSEYILHQSSISTDEELNKEEKARKKASYSEIDLCHCNCQCIQCTGYHRDGHYSLNICHPSCYITRCCDGISAWYWEEEEDMKSLLPTPVRYSMSSTSHQQTSSPSLPTEVEEIESVIRENDL
jgi:hypothetical protein